MAGAGARKDRTFQETVALLASAPSGSECAWPWASGRLAHVDRVGAALWTSRRFVLSSMVILSAMAVDSHAQAPSKQALVGALQRGGYVMVMRHASSPSLPPDQRTANPDNPTRERQLDEAGRAGATRMGDALRTLRIPIGSVLTSPMYRALETVRLARLSSPEQHVELREAGQSMQGVTEAQAVWLRARVAQHPTTGNTLIVTHSTNIARAFPDWKAVDQGEVVVVDANGNVVGRIAIDDWPRLSR